MDELGWEVVASLMWGMLGGGTLSALLAAWLARRKIQALGRSIEVRGELQVVDAAVKVARQLREDLERVTHRVESVEERNRELEALVSSLRRDNLNLQVRLKQLERENGDLRRRCARLEVEKERLRKWVENGGRD